MKYIFLPISFEYSAVPLCFWSPLVGYRSAWASGNLPELTGLTSVPLSYSFLGHSKMSAVWTKKVPIAKADSCDNGKEMPVMSAPLRTLSEAPDMNEG